MVAVEVELEVELDALEGAGGETTAALDSHKIHKILRSFPSSVVSSFHRLARRGRRMSRCVRRPVTNGTHSVVWSD